MKLTLIILMTLSGVLVGQSPNVSREEVAGRVSPVARQLLHMNGLGDSDYQRAKNEGVAQIHTEIDRFLISSDSGKLDPGQVAADLKLILREQAVSSDYADEPTVRIRHLRDGRSMVVSYLLQTSRIDDSNCTIRAYKADRDQVTLMATTGNDFDGYGMFTRELDSPVSGELWLLAWGQRRGFNGKMVRFRMYTFDGSQLRTIWSPSDMFDAELRILESGYVIQHTDLERFARRTPPYTVRDEYRLSITGPQLTVSSYVQLQ